MSSPPLRPFRAASIGLRAVAVLAAASGCANPTDIVCTEQAVSGLSVQVRDSITGLPAGAGATVLATEGAYQETLTYGGTADPAGFHGAIERPGRYRIDITRAGYQPWTRADVVVAEDECHVIPTLVLARLQPTQ
jgi:hypothetical protein